MNKKPEKILVDQELYRNSIASNELSSLGMDPFENIPKEFKRPIVTMSKLLNSIFQDTKENGYLTDDIVIGGGSAELFYETLMVSNNLIIYIPKELYAKARKLQFDPNNTFKDWFCNDGGLVPYMEIMDFEPSDLNLFEIDGHDFNVVTPDLLLKLNNTDSNIGLNGRQFSPMQVAERMGMESRLKENKLI